MEQPSERELAGARAHYAFEMRRRRSWPAEDYDVVALAAAVNERTGLDYTHEAARGWLRGAQPKEHEARLAMAAELETTPEWLYWGRGEELPGFAEALPGLIEKLRRPAAETRRTKPTAKKARRPVHPPTEADRQAAKRRRG